jgi:zinc/manganese transport system substrate-binding protein
VAASIDAWGSVLAQIGGSKVRETSIITDPNTDPHDYEPTPADGRTIAESSVFVENGVGYDSWAAKSLAASPSSGRMVVDVGTVTGTPGDGNPHRWYDPANVHRVADAITSALVAAEPGEADYFRAQEQHFLEADLAAYTSLLASIRASYAGVPIGASESIVSPLAQALGLDLITPPSFLKAISEGADPSSADKATIDRQIADRRIEVYVVNSQNSTPDIQRQVDAARAQDIPVVPVTETLAPAGATFQQWQVRQLTALQAALRAATGR